MSSTPIGLPGFPRRRPAAGAWLSADPEVRSIQVGILATVILHLLLLLLAPRMSSWGSGSPAAAAEEDRNREFTVEMDEPQPPEAKPDPMKFVETNPDAPENTPDKTNNFAARNQQVAQEVPTPDGKSDSPAIDGQTEIPSTQIVTGHLTEPNPPQLAQMEVPITATTEAVQAAKREQNPLSGFEKEEGADPDALGSNVAKIAPNSEAVPEKVEGAKDAPKIDGANLVAIQIDPQKPQPRPTLDRNTRPAIFQKNEIGTRNIGNIARDARWSNYGEYLQKMVEVVQRRWENLIAQSHTYPNPGTSVEVKFTMNSAGEIETLKSVEGTAGLQGKSWCATAISGPEGFTYGPWTNDMIAVLGPKQELTFTFYYQP